MAIESRLSVMMGERKYNMQDVIDKTGLDRTTVSNFYHDKLKRIDLKMLDKLCDLFDCEASDLLRRIKNESDDE